MFEYRGKTALITGASSGIGKAFARELAERGMNLVLVARSEDKLQTLGRELQQTYGIRADALSIDLSREDAGLTVDRAVRQQGLAIDLLINNAGFLNYGKFEEIPADLDRRQIALNAMALVDLTHTFIPELIARQGGIINVASSGGFQPMPYMAVYGATKAFVLSFSEALWAEYRQRGLRVLALCPGPTKTGALADIFDDGKAMSSERVVRDALIAFDRRANYTVTGIKNYWLANAVPRFLPRSIVARILAGITQPR